MPMKWTFSLLFLTLLVSCAAPRHGNSTEPIGTRMTGLELTSWLEERAANAKSGFAQFVSRDGRLYNKDSDAALHFKADQRVEMEEFGYAPRLYPGTYTLDPSGIISLNLKGFPTTWPDMLVYKDGADIRLYPVDPKMAFVMGGPRGANHSRKMHPFWPFRFVAAP